MFDGRAPEVELKVNDNISIKLNANDLVQGAKDQVTDAIKRAGK